ncbi:hypothetical protein BDV95DRAFT_224856 [Massariosphaeria phaeospora]|uniref:Uncharacterized protein n=1 Tax=Massariosphaeria phaeospora TaxID=100035 RepID=A0A7C8MW05_9PLEO|nr:hypothetical protein BDV95DRAFT_224856 [Massariosphaeria phaeospora]
MHRSNRATTSGDSGGGGITLPSRFQTVNNSDALPPGEDDSRDSTQIPPSPGPSASSSMSPHAKVHGPVPQQVVGLPTQDQGSAMMQSERHMSKNSQGISPAMMRSERRMSTNSQAVSSTIGSPATTPQQNPQVTSPAMMRSERRMSSISQAMSGTMGSPATTQQTPQVMSPATMRSERRMSTISQAMSGTMGSPASIMRQNLQLKSPEALSRRDQMLLYGSPQSLQQGSPQSINQESPRTVHRRVPTSSDPMSPSQARGLLARARAPTLQHPVVGITNRGVQTIYSIPEYLIVEEFAFRRGQQDRAQERDRVPDNPFDKRHDTVWSQHYSLGKQSTGDPVVIPSTQGFQAGNNFDWPGLINPYTQTPEHPRGTFDPVFVRNNCDSALKGMVMLIEKVCLRGRDWDRLVCDVSPQIAMACEHFPDLADRYKSLKRDANVAMNGGRPLGY